MVISGMLGHFHNGLVKLQRSGVKRQNFARGRIVSLSFSRDIGLQNAGDIGIVGQILFCCIEICVRIVVARMSAK